jgi:IclR family acetate operon transcriptional repressor
MADGRSRKGNRSTQTGSAADPHGHSDLTDPRAVSTSVTKAFRIVELLAAKPNGGLTLAELSLELGMPKSTTHRYLTTLVALGLTERDGADHFHVGTKLVELAGSFLANSDLRTESNAILDELAATTGETVHLAVPSGGEVVYIAKVESIHALRMYSHIGARLPMHSTSLGKAILAHLPVARVDEILVEPMRARTARTITSSRELAVELDRIRQQGFAIDDEENEVGVCCVGAAVFDYMAVPVAAVSISGPINRMSRERCVTLGPMVRDAALRVSRRMGYTR